MDWRLNSENGIVRQSQLEAELSNAEFSGISNRYIPIGDSTKLARNAAMGSSSLPARVARCQMHLPIRGTALGLGRVEASGRTEPVVARVQAFSVVLRPIIVRGIAQRVRFPALHAS